MGNKTRHTANLVSDNNLFVDIANDRVGIGSTQPTAKLNVAGIVSATSFIGDGSQLSGVTVTGNASLQQLTVSGNITANGNIVGDNSTNITGISGVTASTLTGTLQTAAQTNITSVGTLGSLTVSGNITANGNIVGDNATNISGVNQVTATTFSGSGASLTGLTGASAATYGGASVSPQITVDANGRITGITNVSIAGGGGGGGSSIIVQNSQSVIGAAGTIDFGTGLSVSAITAGVATVTAAETDTLATVTGRGASTTNDVSVGKLTVDKGGNTVGKLDIEDKGTYSQIQFYNNNGDPKVALKGVADNLYIEGGGGIIRLHTHANFSSNGSVVLNDGGNGGTDIEGTLNVTGVSTFQGNARCEGDLRLLDARKLILGSDIITNDLEIYHGGSLDNHGYVKSNNGNLYLASGNNGAVHLRGFNTSNLIVQQTSVQLKHSGNQKLETTSTGVTVTGNIDISGNIDTVTDISCNSIVNNAGGGATWSLFNTGNATFSATVTANTFSGSGASLTNLPAANLTGTLPAISGANLTNLPAPTPADTDVQVTYDVSSNGSSAYRFTGPGYSGADDNPDIYLVRGQRYRFINGTGSSHPFRIQSDTSGTAYTDGVSGSQSGTQDFNVQHDAPTHLYYQCTIHSGMLGNIYIVGEASGRLGINAHNASTYTLVAGDAGKLVREATNSANITIPQNVFSAGDMISIFNVSTGNNTITSGSGITLYNTADGATGNRTLAAKGVCTIVCTNPNEFIISGSGLS